MTRWFSQLTSPISWRREERHPPRRGTGFEARRAGPLTPTEVFGPRSKVQVYILLTAKTMKDEKGFATAADEAENRFRLANPSHREWLYNKFGARLRTDAE